MVIQGCAKLEESRRVAEAELAALDASEERVRELKADRDAFIAFHAEAVPEELDGLSGEKRMRIYQMLRLKVRPNPRDARSAGRFVMEGRRAQRCSAKSSPRARIDGIMLRRLMARRNPPGMGILRLAAAILLIGGPILGIIFRSWGLGSMVFGLGAIVLGVRQIHLGEHRSERLIGVGLLLGGAFTAIEGLVRLLLGVSP